MYSNAHNALIIVLFVVAAGAIIYARHHKAQVAVLEEKAKAEIAALKQKLEAALNKSKPSA